LKKKFLKRLRIISLVFLLFTILLVQFAMPTIHGSWPQETGKIRVPGLQDRVEVFRDAWGVPHIYAANQHDLFMAQGYIHAQDRFWQMDFWRHIGSGRLAEMFGKSQLSTDKFLRTLGWARIAQKELKQSAPNTIAILNAYSEGVNAYLAKHHGDSLSLEYAVLKLANPKYQPEPWQPIHSLTWAKAMAWNLSQNISSEIERAILLRSLTPNQVDELFPPYPKEHPIVVPQSNLTTGKADSPNSLSSFSAISSALLNVTQKLTIVNNFLEAEADRNDIGSNNWIISGQRTDTGKPIFANDVHLTPQMPSVWYEVGLHCTSNRSICPYKVVGFSFAGVPGIMIGHNARITWGMTNFRADVMDLYVEEINPKNSNQYAVNGKWVDMQLIKDSIQVAGSNSVPITVRYTRHGPIISETYREIKNFNQKSGVQLPKHYAIALRWTALEPSTTYQGMLKILQAQNWEEFRAAAKEFDVPNQNLGYADINGNIGYQATGKIPVRVKGDGRYPVSGETNEYEWKKYIPFENLPSVFNPSQKYIVTANNAVVDSDYPYFISADWDYGYRAKRIVEMIEEKKDPITLKYIQQMQGDNKNLNAEMLVPILVQVPLKDKHLEDVRRIFQNWDFQNKLDQPAPALFETFWKHLLADTFHDKLPEEYWPDGGSRWVQVIRRIVHQPNSFWWDNKKTFITEDRDRIFHQAFAKAVKELEHSLGKDYRNWHWGNLHTVAFRNLSLGKSGNIFIQALFNRGPFATSGGSSIINDTGWNASQSFDVNWLPEMRMIVDLSNLQNTFAINTTGQSGHAFHQHYDDMIEPWRNIQYHTMLWDERSVKIKKFAHLTLSAS
jgi:penicillin amidase